MVRSITCLVVVSFFFIAPRAVAQPGKEKVTPIVKNDAAPLPPGARLQLGKLAGFRHIGRPTTAILSADGRLLAAADSPATITIVNTETGKVVQTLKRTPTDGTNLGLTFSADSSTLAIQSDGHVIVWDVASGKQLRDVQTRVGNGSRHQGPSLSDDGKVVVAGDCLPLNRQTGEVKVVEVATGKIVEAFESIHNSNLRTAIARDGKTLIAWGKHTADDRVAPNTIQVWDLVKGKELRKDFIFSNVRSAALTPDGKSIVAHTAAGSFQWIDIATGDEIRRFAGEYAVGSATLCFSPDGKRLVAYDANGGVQAWDAAEARRIPLVNAPKTQVIGVAFPDQERIVLLGMLGSTLYWWDATDATASVFEGHLAPVKTLAFTADGRSLVSGDDSLRFIWWDPATGQQQRRLVLPALDRRNAGHIRLNAQALAPDGLHAATFFYSGARSLQLWDLSTARIVREFKPVPWSGLVAVHFSPDGKTIAVSGPYSSGRVWEIETGVEVYGAPKDKPGLHLDSRVAISPNGKMLAIHRLSRGRPQDDDKLILWDLVEKKELRRVNLADFDAASRVAGIAFSADGRLIAVDDGQSAILLLDAATGRELQKLTSAAYNRAPHIAFSADGRFLAVGGSEGFDGLLEIWEIASGRRRDQFKGHAAGITCLAFSPGGATVASGSIDTSVLLWDIAGKSTKVAPFAANEIPAAWRSLTGDATTLSLTMRRLTQSPATLGFFKDHFLPAKHGDVDEKKLRKLIADLDSGNFKTRELAMRELRLLGERAEASLQKALAGNPPIEMRRRIVDLLDVLVRMHVTPEELQAIRGVEILERIGTPDARAWLTALSRGDSHARSTHEATAALKRLARK